MTQPSVPQRIQGPSALAPMKESARRAQLRRTSQQFEAVLVTRLLESMNKTTLASGMFGKGVENDIYASFMNEAVAEKVAARGGMGIAPMLEKTLAKKLEKEEGARAAKTDGAANAVKAPPPQLQPLRPATPRVPVADRATLERRLKAFDATPRPEPVSVAPPQGSFGSLAAGIEGPVPDSPAPLGLASRIELGVEPPVQAGSPDLPAVETQRSPEPLPVRVAAAPEKRPAPRVHAAPPPSRPPHPLDAAIAMASRESGVDPGLLKAVMLTESSGRAGAVSPKGARGLMQLMPDTARAMGVRNPMDPVESLRGGARYLAHLLDRFGGSVTRALAAYNAGPTAVERHKGVPPYPETRRYVARVLQHRRRLGAVS